MTAAGDAREHLTAVIFEVLSAYTAAPRVHHADLIHTAAERYGHALADECEGDAIKQLRLKQAAAEYGGRPCGS